MRIRWMERIQEERRSCGGVNLKFEISGTKWRRDKDYELRLVYEVLQTCRC